MPSFLTQCPHCLTPFRVTETQLEAAEGLVRCGACLGIFSATSNRITLKQTPEEAAAASALAEPAEIPDEIAAPEAHAEAEPPAPGREPDYALTPHYEPFGHDSDAEEEPVQEQAALPTDEADAILESPSHERDLDIPLGNFDLDAEEDFDEDEAEDEDEDEYDDETDSDYDDAEDEDDDEEDDVEADEEEDYAEEFADEDDDAIAEAAEAIATAPEAEVDLPETRVRRAAYERTITDKTALRQYLAEIEDDEALGPLDDSTLDAFSDEPVTLVAVPRRSRLTTFALFSANLLLAVALALQYVHGNLDELSRNARLAPLLPYVCRVFACPVIERSQLDRLVSEQLLVRSHPRYAQALEVRFVFRNDALEAQPFPALELSFNDTNNQLLANRLFKPAEYLPPELQTSEMPAQSSLPITLEMADPGSEAVNYTLAFRAP